MKIHTNEDDKNILSKSIYSPKIPFPIIGARRKVRSKAIKSSYFVAFFIKIIFPPKKNPAHFYSLYFIIRTKILFNYSATSVQEVTVELLHPLMQ